jgi:hypothetical protein
MTMRRYPCVLAIEGTNGRTLPEDIGDGCIADHLSSQSLLTDAWTANEVLHGSDRSRWDSILEDAAPARTRSTRRETRFVSWHASGPSVLMDVEDSERILLEQGDTQACNRAAVQHYLTEADGGSSPSWRQVRCTSSSSCL